MRLRHLLFSFTIFFFFLLLSNADDADVMHKLSQAFSPRPPGWSTSSSPCSWQGVRCDSLNRVVSINLMSKSLSGKLPADLLNRLTSLQSLSLQRNRISGTLPSLSNLNNLKEAYFDGNKFTSFPSNFLSNLPNLQTLSLDNNPLNPWTLKEETLSQLSSLEVFRASNTNTYGPLPDVFESLSGLQDLRLSYNNLTGAFPPSLARSSIRHLWINDQKAKFSGTLDQLSEMTSLVQAWLHNNAFSGPIPDLSKCTQLFDLQLRGNRLTGLVPPSLKNLPELANVSLQNNMLQGPMPTFKNWVKTSVLPGNRFCNPKPGSCDPQVMVLLEIVGAVGYPTQLAEAWKGNNACDGWAHVTCDPAQKVVIGINFAKEGFDGTISPKFANLTSLTSLVLSDNKLYGKIPSSLLSLKHLQRLDLSSNNLTGKVPSFSKSVAVNVDNNPFIGTNVDTTPGGGNQKRSSSKRLLFLIVGIVLAILIVGFSFLMYLAFGKRFFRRRFGNGRSKMGDDRMNSGVGSSMASSKGPFDGGSATYSIELLREVTNHFSNKNILGKGGFGVVYKGELQDGTRIAVKRMESDSLGIKGLSEFEAEIAVLSKVRHRHLVALLGFCVNRTERFLVYECMPEGTLGQHLFEWKELGCAPLAWKQRLVIALDVARGVEYLHSLAQESFIHRDLKPSNILLGSDMRAKVSDFGLVRNAPDGKHSVETRVAGTFGYLAPEYVATGRVTTKVDVFAYGVVLMEMITGRKALDRTLPEDQIQIVTWFRRVFADKKNARKSIDPSMELDEEMHESVCKVAELAGHCTAREPLQRPDMGHVVSALSPLVDQWKPAECGNEESVCIDVQWAMKSWQTGETSTTVRQSRRFDSSAE